jgi:hypothetical protein
MTSDRLMEVYNKFRYYDRLFSKYAVDDNATISLRMLGEMWVAVRDEIENGDDGK